MSRALCYIGLGANLGRASDTLQEVIGNLRQEPLCHGLQASSRYASKPMGPQDQPDFINAVVKLETPASPLTLLDLLQHYEQQAGRIRGQHWGPRTLDLDLLLYADRLINTPRLQVPHPGLTEREFVVTPLAEIAPTLVLPNGLTAAELAATLPPRGLRKLDPAPVC